MSDLNDDLLNYELGDDILLDQVLYGADEDELLLSDDDLEKDVSKEEKKQLKAEAEQWVKSKIVREGQQKLALQAQNTKNALSNNTTKTVAIAQAKAAAAAATAGGGGVLSTAVAECKTKNESSVISTETAAKMLTETTEISSTIIAATASNENATADASTSLESVTTSGEKIAQVEAPKEQIPETIIINAEAKKEEADKEKETEEGSKKTNEANITDEVSSSSNKDCAAIISCSTSSHTEVITTNKTCSQEQSANSGEFSDPREDFDEERDGARTNIKTTSERDMETKNHEQSPDKHHSGRFMHGKRLNNLMQRPHGMRNIGMYPNHQRPLLRFPPHGQFPQHSNPYGTQQQQPILPQSQSSNTQQQINVPTTAQTTTIHTQHHQPQQSQQQHETLPIHPNHHAHGPRGPMHHPYALGYRPGLPGHGPHGFRPPNPNGMFVGPHGPQQAPPHEYHTVPPPGFGQNFLHNPMGMHHHHHLQQQHHPPRGMYRGELPPPPGAAQGMPRAMMRLPRAPLPPNYAVGPMQPAPPQLANQLRHPMPPASVPPTQPHQPPTGMSILPTATISAAPLMPSKVLINPNFKGGVEAATSKFIKETQYMATIGATAPHMSSHMKSDDELLRQQEEFINKNRQHIEKRRQERFSPPSGSRRERSYSPGKRGVGVASSSGGGGGITAVSDARHGYFERDNRERDRVNSRERDRANSRERDRANSRERDRANSRERDRETSNRKNENWRDWKLRCNRSNNQYNKRRRSLSLSPSNRNTNNTNGRRGSERVRKEVEEDEETRAYRLEIEKQKALREKILRDKEVKRRRAAEEKLHEDKRSGNQTNPSGTNNANDERHSQQQQQAAQLQQQQQISQQLKPIIVTERKIITLKKRNEQQQQQQQLETSPIKQTQVRKQLTSAKILPEGKRSLATHLSGNSKSNKSSSGKNTTSGGIDGVQHKKETTQTTIKTSSSETGIGGKNISESSPKEKMHATLGGTHSDDEVELDYDADELMLEEEDRLLASPTPSRSPSPQQERTKKNNSNNNNSSDHKNIYKNVNRKNNTTTAATTTSTSSSSSSSTAQLFNISNRRVVLKSSTSTSAVFAAEGTTVSGNNSGRGGGGGRRNSKDHETLNSSSHGRSTRSSGNNNNNKNREHIFERLDARGESSKRSKLGQPQQQQRVVIKHN